MFIIIVGGGKVGTYLTRSLLAQGHEVVVIEKDARKAQRLGAMLDTDVVVLGDGCDPFVLADAGLGRSDVVIANTGEDEDNLVVMLIAAKRALRPPRCIARVNNPRNKAIFESIARDYPVMVVSATETILDLVGHQVDVGEQSTLLTLRNGAIELARFTVAPASPANGEYLAALPLPRNSVVVAVERGEGELIVPSGETMVRVGDAVLVLAPRSARDAVRAAFFRASADPAR